MRELDLELQMYKEECIRLRSVLETQVSQNQALMGQIAEIKQLAFEAQPQFRKAREPSPACQREILRHTRVIQELKSKLKL